MEWGGGLKSSYSSRKSFHESAIFHYIIIILIIATLIISVLAFNDIRDLKASLIPITIDIDDFLSKLTGHDEMKAYVGVAPLNTIPITNNNLANLQTQINGLDVSYLGAFIVQYTDAIVIFDYNNDVIREIISLQQPQQEPLPADLFTKLNKHPELKGLENEQPVGGQFNADSLNTLKQQFPDVYANAKVSDYLLRYTTMLIIYDYNADTIVNSVDLS